MRTGFAALASQIVLTLLPLHAVSADPCDWERVANLKSWRQLHHFLQRFNCVDDGMRAEAYSHLVVHNLATKWETLPELQSLAKADVLFRKFILSHIDATADRAELKIVKQNATQRCRSGNTLCDAIANAAAKASAEQPH
jgi:hypothetical protein